MKEECVVKCRGTQDSPANKPLSCKKVASGCQKSAKGYQEGTNINHNEPGSPKTKRWTKIDGSVVKSRVVG